MMLVIGAALVLASLYVLTLVVRANHLGRPARLFIERAPVAARLRDIRIRPSAGELGSLASRAPPPLSERRGDHDPGLADRE